ncbi:MAG: DUF512 domain-containing protein [Ruminococcaceae bacterium]|nr:DUF512 domain-containing protein [Oscillospiraceae bacterium]
MKILSVEPGGAAARAKLLAGDEILAVNGHEIRDVIDLKYYTYESRLKLRILRAGKERTVRVKKPEGDELGLQFEDYLMDSARHCQNKCVFCFIDQLPKGMRDTLYFKDDDVRMSFLMGNYITLTNLTDYDITRILEMRISPVNVSVQVTDPEARVRMLKNPKAGKCLELMQMLAAHSIRMNCQIVLCPGFNDGELLEKSLRDLVDLFPAVPSVSIVPVGLSDHREGLCPLQAVTPEKAREVIAVADRYGEECLERFGSRVIYCADEFYLKAGLPIPDPEYYEDYPQIENGVGLMASFEDEVRQAAALVPRDAEIRPFSIATGVAAAEYMRKMVDIILEKCDTIPEHPVYMVENRFFGSQITVAGLLTGQDLLRALKDKPLGERVFITESMLKYGEELFLDDMTVTELSAALGVPVIPVRVNGFDFRDALLGK